MKKCWQGNRRKSHDTHNEKATKEMDWTHAYRRFTAKNSYRMKNGGKENKRKTKTYDAGLSDGGW